MQKLSNVDLNLLTIFAAIYECSGVTAAARKLNLSQPAVSHALGRLRLVFDDALFVRSGNYLVPTAMAHQAIVPVREALRQLASALATGGIFNPSASDRTFAIGLRQGSETRLFSEIFAALHAAAPQAVLKSARFQRRALLQALSDRQLDIAIDIRLPTETGLMAERIDLDPLIVMGRANHPRLNDALDLKTYLSLGHIVISSRVEGTTFEDQALKEAGLKRIVACRCQHVWAACEVMARSDLICTLPRSFATELAARWPSKLHELPFAVPSSEITMYWHEAYDREPANIWLRQLVREAAAAKSATGVEGHRGR